jgi:hypothetical protein
MGPELFSAPGPLCFFPFLAGVLEPKQNFLISISRENIKNIINFLVQKWHILSGGRPFCMRI